MQKPVWAILALLLALPPMANAQQNRPTMDPIHNDPCISLAGNPEAYAQCREGATEGVGIACTIYTWNPFTRVIQTAVQIVVSQTCPDNGLAQAQAQAQAAAWALQQAKRVMCRNGQVPNPGGGCVCPDGTNWNGYNCVRQPNPEGLPQTPPPPTWQPPAVPPGSCSSGGPNEPAICPE